MLQPKGEDFLSSSSSGFGEFTSRGDFGGAGSSGGFSGAGSGGGFADAASSGEFGGGSNFGFAVTNNAGTGFEVARVGFGFKSDMVFY